jgi:ribosome-binding factor A
MTERKEKVANYIKELAAKFLERESTRNSLITVTNSSCSPDLKRATIFFTVLPESEEEAALAFAKRKRPELREFIKKNLKIKIIPFLDIELDRGEKNFIKTEQILQKENSK